MRPSFGFLLVVLTLVLATAAQAQNYPDRPIRIVASRSRPPATLQRTVEHLSRLLAVIAAV